MLCIENMSVTRGKGEQRFTVSLPTLHLADGDVLAIQGTSGCGKSTLLEMIGLILQPEQLSGFQFGKQGALLDIHRLIQQQNQPALAQIRAEKLGFMLQNGGLLPFLTVAQNIELPNALLQSSVDQQWVAFLCQELNIGHLLTKYPKQLSIGERQRVAFIRAVAHKPLVLLADEPTSALDPHHADVLFSLILDLVAQQNISVLLVTHDWELVKRKQLRALSANLLSPQHAIFTDIS
ncbi:ABC transporter ATP-binding protein [Pasteurella multocida]|uniref:ABC transporter ATP-binding protein n=1 Tax=Pasteurella multocida TaxID=747 RepID=UPI0004AB5219|nr:ABC transporter ATP-binding protein [Pasteurella multocida]ATC21781.1 ABC transporter ATP-binding protein [Pasteurella multocida]KEP94383.1 ABC transporter ATP-binding protein [Pasteurella multocida subsp. multocida VTCCBAA264]KLT48198.1 ABC transporter ATP-binding protein [Pasteurella multocida subsp. multocida]KLT51901.1 ABC transporter ATP-binding protein [Pasteurella multocida subsp. multocida]KLT52514.1 ABC transporter ATP-binding protein [Pasteurella multocida subsp. multocida]